MSFILKRGMITVSVTFKFILHSCIGKRRKRKIWWNKQVCKDLNVL